MDRNALLAATRAEFIQGFLQAVDHAIAQAKVVVFRKADFSFSQTEQRILLDVHRILQERHPELRLHLQRNMEQLLNRSFQTTYSTFRPSFSREFSSSSLSLVDASQFEDQLRVDEITNRFRNAADQQLRDLNIRIALLFEQNTIKERENPFRPWLFTRCIAASVEALGIRAELIPVASVQIAEQLEESVAVIYNGINTFLAENGIAAQLQLKIQRTAGAGPALAGGRVDSTSAAAEAVAAAAVSAPGAGELGGVRNPTQPASGPVSAPFPANALQAEAMEAAASARIQDMMHRVRQYASGQLAAQADGQPGVLTNGHAGTRLTEQASRIPSDARGEAGSSGSASLTSSLSDGERAAVAAGRAAHAQANGSETPLPAGSWLARNGLGEVMRRFLAGDATRRMPDAGTSGGRIEPRLGGGVDRQVSAPLAQSVQGMLDLPANVAVQDASQPVKNLILEQRAALVGATGDVSEQMTIDVVAMLFEFILRDSQIPAEVRAQLGRLQFLVLKIALRESTLLTQQGHPARMLVNRIGSISIGLRQLDPSGARISSEICRIVESLLAGDTSSSTPFSAMLDEFDSFIANEFRTGNAQVERAVQVIEDAQSRTLRYTHLSAQLDEALFGLSLDAFLRDFLMHSWTYVIERAERQADPQAIRFRQVVPELLWSIVPRTAADNRSELMSVLPRIVRTIRDGLILLEWDTARQQTVLDWLVAAHRSVLRGVPEAKPAPTLQSLRQHFSRFTEGAEETPPALAVQAADSAPQQVFLDQAIREADGALRRVGPMMPAADGSAPVAGGDAMMPPDPPASAQAGGALAGHPVAAGVVGSDPSADFSTALGDDPVDPALLDRLRTGVAVSLKLGDVAGNAQLTWIDQKKSTLVLSIEGQPAPVLISMRMFRRMQANGRLRFVETAPLFERAIASVQKSADSV